MAIANPAQNPGLSFVAAAKPKQSVRIETVDFHSNLLSGQKGNFVFKRPFVGGPTPRRAPPSTSDRLVYTSRRSRILLSQTNITSNAASHIMSQRSLSVSYSSSVLLILYLWTQEFPSPCHIADKYTLFDIRFRGDWSPWQLFFNLQSWSFHFKFLPVAISTFPIRNCFGQTLNVGKTAVVGLPVVHACPPFFMMPMEFRDECDGG